MMRQRLPNPYAAGPSMHRMPNGQMMPGSMHGQMPGVPLPQVPLQNHNMAPQQPQEGGLDPMVKMFQDRMGGKVDKFNDRKDKVMKMLKFLVPGG